MRKDPGMRRDVSPSQGVNITDPPSYSSRSERSASREPEAKRLCLRPTQAEQQNVPLNTIHPANPVSASTVLPTAGNSPHPLVTPATPNESALRVVSNTSEGHQLFNFTRPAARVPVLMPQISVSSTVNRTNSSHIVFPVSSLCKASASPNNINVVDSRFIRTVEPAPVSRQWPLSVETDAGLFAPAPVIKTQPEMTNTFSMPPNSTVGKNRLQPLPIRSP
ncbi:hypothetical protein ElyMa_006576400 [Elysia marginata]|uniref:Uncharacterized protein n=1 Tax=Elysia marginata TaxID=1093978 RepID=A0AAV4ICX5_9GAST|nr:hypothetical protein ElyMa_006576400 [Elysia marginata]